MRPADELDEIKSKRGSIKDKSMTKAITEIYLTRLLSVKVQRRDLSRHLLCHYPLFTRYINLLFEREASLSLICLQLVWKMLIYLEQYSLSITLWTNTRLSGLSLPSAPSHIICCLFQGTLQQFVDDFFRSVLCTGAVVPPAVKYFFDFLDEQALKHSVDDETIHIWKTNR